ncbi:zona pellucida sperm-binding protein 3-like [Brienomyrus brachyistius]|uniref:zona pellucida sperm-binding protein 3-like n=1 Tax=Brienomyrus brachyistius TaxID=42636 RepID=UPI0020B2ECEB|nr:zona pellucida sperm-binding protein 3-like [Brienomyrus brachyistius]
MGLQSSIVVVLLLFGWVCNAWPPLKMSPAVTLYPVSIKSNIEAQTAIAAVSKAQTQLGQSVAAAISRVQAALGQVRPMVATTTASVPLGQVQFGKREPPSATGSQGLLQLGQVGPAVAASPPAQTSPNAVKATCSESSVIVEVQRDLMGTGRLVQPADITLGGCAAVAQDASAQVLRFESKLQDCGSQLMMTDNSLVYTFALIYVPTGIGGTPIVRTNGAVLSIECHYLRKHNVSSNALVPTWVPFSTTKAAEDILVFSLKLMADDWQLERTSNAFFLGDLLNIEASVTVANHHPLRVSVDSCVATSTSDVTSVPRYDLVVNHGCLSDSKLPGSNSHFLPQKQDDKLQMQLDAFRFLQATSNLIYITCLLKATVASGPTDETHKACSFSSTRWTAADGNDQVCGCCDADCSPRKARDLTLWWESTATVGPFSVAEKPLLHGGHQAPGAEMSKVEDQTAHTGVSPEYMALAGVLAAVALLVVGVLGFVLHWK